MSDTRRYFDKHELMKIIYHKIAIWHNNDEKLSPIELGRELKFLSNEIIEDVVKGIFDSEIVLDKERLGMTEQEIKEYDDRMRKYQDGTANRADEDVKTGS